MQNKPGFSEKSGTKRVTKTDCQSLPYRTGTDYYISCRDVLVRTEKSILLFIPWPRDSSEQEGTNIGEYSNRLTNSRL